MTPAESTFLSIEKYIPQRAPFVMVDRIVKAGTEEFVTEFCVREANVLLENGLFREAGILENVAQTCAAFIGFANPRKPVPLGVIGGISNFKLEMPVRVNQLLTTSVHIVMNLETALVVEAEVCVQGALVATCSMKVFTVNN